jgi:hypothetical protein
MKTRRWDSPETERMSKPSLDEFVGRVIVLDTQGALVYIGRLVAIDERGYWLEDADVHDRDEGHSGNEKYVNDAHLLEREGARAVNRKRVFVERAAIVSISALDDVVADKSDDHMRLGDNETDLEKTADPTPPPLRDIAGG